MKDSINVRHVYEVMLDENLNDVLFPVATVVQRGTNVSYAVCNECDQFVKKTGINIAVNRMTSKGRVYKGEDHTFLPKSKRVLGERIVGRIDEEGDYVLDNMWEVIHDVAAEMIMNDIDVELDLTHTEGVTNAVTP
jgi:hypothetical protein